MNDRLSKITHALAISLCWFSLSTYAGNVYKWTDEQGQVHFGDQQQFEAVKPSKSVKIDMPTAHNKEYTTEEINTRLKMLDDVRSKIHTERDTPVQPQVVADLSKINPQCETLAQQIMNTPQGQPFKPLADQMTSLCPGLTYECRQYRKHPKDNECHFAQKTSGSIVHSTVTD